MHLKGGMVEHGGATTEVDEEGVEVAVHHDVVGLQVAVEYSPVPQKTESLGQFVCYAEALEEGEG